MDGGCLGCQSIQFLTTFPRSRFQKGMVEKYTATRPWPLLEWDNAENAWFIAGDALGRFAGSLNEWPIDWEEWNLTYKWLLFNDSGTMKQECWHIRRNLSNSCQDKHQHECLGVTVISNNIALTDLLARQTRKRMHGLWLITHWVVAAYKPYWMGDQ